MAGNRGESPRPSFEQIRAEQMGRVTKVCERLKERYPSFRGAYQFGSPGGDDIDLRLCFPFLPKEKDQEKIRKKFQELKLTQPVDVRFITEDEIINGPKPNLSRKDAVTYLKSGFDPHTEPAAVSDPSLFALYVFATMRKFYEASEGSLLDPRIAMDNIRLTREGAIGWVHYYTGNFIYEKKQFEKEGRQDSPEYQKRLAKYFCRITFGRILAQLREDQLQQIQPKLIAAIQATDKGTSNDEKIIEVLLADIDTKSHISERETELLLTAGRIRSGKQKDLVEKFAQQAETLLFYRASLQGTERKLS